MRQCWPDGDLRAHLDGELPVESLERIAAHLEVCAGCSERYNELAARARRVSNLMAILPADATAQAVHVLPVRPRHRRRWAVAALSLAAALAVGFVILPKKPVRKPPAVAQVAAPILPVVAASIPPRARPVIRHTPAHRPAIRENFLRLDDEPLETGTVVRISAENGDVQAELIMGPDGQAHAIRVVNNQ